MSFRWNLRKVEEDDDFIYQYAFDWHQKLPSFLKSLGTSYTPNEFSKFEKDLRKGFNFAAFDNNKLVAVVNASILDKITLEGHLFCSSESNEDIITSLISFAKYECLFQYNTIMCHIVQRHKFLHKVMIRSGFVNTGLKTLGGDKLVPVAIYLTTKI